MIESTKESEDAYVRRLQGAVCNVKASREMRARYMIFQEMLQEERKAGKAEAVLDLLGDLPGAVPEELKNVILAEKDEEMLRRYLRQARSANSVEEFMRNISGTEQS